MVNGLVLSAAAVGIALTYRVFGSLIDAFDWPTAFLIMGGCTALLTLLWTIRAADDPAKFLATNRRAQQPIQRDDAHYQRTSAASTGDWKTVLRNRSVMLLTLSYAAVDYFQYLFFYWMEYYFSRVLRLDQTTSQLYSGIPLVGMAIGMPLGGWLSDRLARKYGYRFGRVAVPFTAMIAGGLFLGAGIFTKEPVWVVFWFTLALSAIGGVEGPTWATVVELGGRRGGTAAGILNTGGNIGGALAPVMTPWISELYGWHWAIGLGAVIALLGAICWLRVVPAETTEAATAAV
jgi:MFS family permease